MRRWSARLPPRARRQKLAGQQCGNITFARVCVCVCVEGGGGAPGHTCARHEGTVLTNGSFHAEWSAYHAVPSRSLLLSFTSVQVATHAQKGTGQRVTGWGPPGSTPRAGRGCLPRAANPSTFQIHVPPMESFLVDKHTRDKNSHFSAKLYKLWQWRSARLLPSLGPSSPWDDSQRTEAAGHAEIPEHGRSTEPQFLAVLPAAAVATQNSAHLHVKVSLATCSSQTTYIVNREKG